MIPARDQIIGAVLVALLAGGLYVNVLDGAFQFDDQTSILENESLRSSDPREWWSYWPTRALSTTLLALDYQAGGAHNPRPYHRTNLLLHAAMALAALALLREVVRPTDRRSWWACVAGACVFAAHPLHTQAAAYIVQRAVLLATTCSLAAIAAYLRASTSRHPGRWYALAWAMGISATLSKEFAVVLPAAMLLADLCVLPREGRVARWAPFALLATIPPLLLALSGGALGNDSVRFSGQSDEVGALGYLWTQTEVVARYYQLAILPFGQNLDHDLAWQLGPSSARWWPWLLPHLLVAAATAFAWRRDHRLSAFALAWFVLTVLPESSIFAIDDAMIEHRMVQPLFGGAVLAALAVRWAARRSDVAAIVGSVAIIAVLATLTVQRNELWRDPLALWEDARAKSPDKARPHMAVGWLLGNRGEHTRAREALERAVELDPDYGMAWNNLGVVATRMGDHALSAHAYAQAIRLHPEESVLYSNLGMALARQDDLDDAATALERALDLDGRSPVALQWLCAVRIRQGRLDEAQQLLPRAEAAGVDVAELRARLAAARSERTED